MSKKTLSLKEFYESHGSSRATPYSSLPVRPRSDRDDDQGLPLRLAQSCSLDSGKAYPQRRALAKEAPYADPGSYGSHSNHSGRDGAPVGDVNYYRPNSSSSYREGPAPRGPSPHDKPAQHSYDPAGPYHHVRGDCSPPGSVPAAGRSSGAAGMGGPVHPSSGHGSYSTYGPPPQHLRRSTGVYGAGPQHLYGPPPPEAYVFGPGGAAASAPGPVAGYQGGHRSAPLRELPVQAGYMGYGMPPGYATPPPPPPPRQPPQQLLGSGLLPEQISRAVGTNASVSQAVATARGGVDKAEKPAGSIVSAAPAGRQSHHQTAVAAGTGDTKPTCVGASVSAAAAVATEPTAEAALAAPKNEFAERLAQKAMASAARAKSSLLAGAGSISSNVDSLSRAGSVPGHGTAELPVAVGVLDILAVAAPAGGDSSGGSSPNDAPGVFVKPAHPYERPRLMLKPRSTPLDGLNHCSGNYSSTSSDSGDAPQEHGSSAAGSAASSVTGGRPRLHLLPRGASLPDSATGGQAAAGTATGARKASVFGEAKPREEVLKGRGLDPALIDAAADIARQASDSAVPPRQSSFADRGSSRLSAAHSNDADEWHTVLSHGRKGSTAQRDARLPNDDDSFDPFFGSKGSVMTASDSLVVPPPRAFSRDIMRNAYNSSSRRSGEYGVPAGRAGGFGEDAATGGEEDSSIFRRALPTRQLPLAL